MEKKILLLIFLYCFLISISQAQNKYPMESIPGRTTVDSVGSHSHKFYVPPPANFLEQQNAKTESATIEVVYNAGFNIAPEAKAAFQFAVDIWASQITSPVTIRVQANWQGLGDGVLGSARAATYFRNFPGAVKVNTWYPVALAEKMASRELNPSSDFDIITNFNSTFDGWYFGTDGNTPGGEYDFVSVVLHELCHGLGFISLDNVEESNNEGSMRASGFPTVFQHFMEDASGQSLLNETLYPDPSVAMGNALTTTLYFDSPIVVANNSNNPVLLYSPRPYEPGSSVSHLNTATYQGTVNGLMTHQANTGTAEHDPGPITINMFKDMGWTHTYLQPDTLKSSETNTGPYTVKAKVFSDDGFDASSLKLYYSTDSFKTAATEVALTATGNTNEYSTNIPAVALNTTVGYYLKVDATDGRVYQAPTEATTVSNYFYYFIGPDNIKPTINHSPINSIVIPTDTVRIEANITDLFEISEATVEYKLNDGSISTAVLTASTEIGSEDLYFKTLQFTGLEDADIISYRIIAKDNSSNKNQQTVPETGFYEIEVKGLQAARPSYNADFSEANINDDFAGNNFSITTPAGFNSPAIHSDHPYADGSGANDESNYTMQLLVPVTVSAENSLMKFDEIVLVEPGETGTNFGEQEFWDYVIIEGSKDGGISWTPLEAGYDATSNSVWLNAYNGGLSGNNSSAEGTPDLYRTRIMDLGSAFNVGDEVSIRFRLFADQAAHGWGWAIDNLVIQGDPSQFIVGLFENNIHPDIQIYPNPAQSSVFLHMHVASPSTKISWFDNSGMLINSYDIPTSGRSEMELEFSLEGLSDGLYHIKIEENGRVTHKKVIVQN